MIWDTNNYNIVGWCHHHQRPITNKFNYAKKYRCSDCKHAIRFNINYWKRSKNVKLYLLNKGLKYNSRLSGKILSITKI